MKRKYQMRETVAITTNKNKIKGIMNGHYVIIINNEHCVYILANLAVKQKHQTQPKALTTLTLSLILQIFVIFKNNFFLKIPQQKNLSKVLTFDKKQRNCNIQRRSLYNSRLKKLLNVKSRNSIFRKGLIQGRLPIEHFFVLFIL